MTIIEINDDFDLYKIAYSGQCFRVRDLGDGAFRFITGEHVLDIRKADNSCAENESHTAPDSIDFRDITQKSSPGLYEVSCSQAEWDSVWHYYFDLNTNYAKIRSSIPLSDKYIHNASQLGEGIRILNQDKFEMLISFIISQRKSIPAIKSSVERICKRYGHLINCESFDSCKSCESRESCESESATYTFPTPYELSKATSEELAECGLGYRVPYVIEATRWAMSLDSLDFLDQLSDEELFTTLKSLYGVGDKVANCISLFGYHRTGRAPIDTWIKKVIDDEYKGHNPFPNYGPNAGIIQQYVFYAKQHMKI